MLGLTLKVDNQIVFYDKSSNEVIGRIVLSLKHKKTQIKLSFDFSENIGIKREKRTQD